MPSLRTKETDATYAAYLKAEQPFASCPLCDKKSVKEFGFWRIVENSFPYDKIAERHDLLLSKSHVKEERIEQQAWYEWQNIKKSYVNDHYDWIVEPTHSGKSIPEHFHLHLLVGKGQ